MRFGIVLFGLALAASPLASAQRKCDAGGAAAGAQVAAFYNEGIRRFNAHDLDGFVAQFASDIDMYTAGGWVRGKPAVTRRFAGIFKSFPNIRMAITGLHTRSIAGNVVLVDFVWEVFPAGQGPRFQGVGSGVYVCREGNWAEAMEHETVTFTDPALQQGSR